ncbi:MAG: sensor histidine kinase [Clostridia bacterium]|nr:sensor histidine kinase [Clostridia bacterium]
MELNTHFIDKNSKKNTRNRFHFKLRSKFILSFFLIVLIPFGIFGFYTYLKSEAVFEKQTSSLALQRITQLSVRVDQQLRDMESLIGQITSNNSIISLYAELPKYSFKNGSSPSYEKLLFYTEALGGIIIPKQQYFRGIYYIDKSTIYNVDTIHLITTPYYEFTYGNETASPLISGLDSRILMQNWYKETQKSPDQTNIVGTNYRYYDNYTSQCVVTVSKVAKDIKTKEYSGVLFLDFDYGILSSLIEGQNNISYPNSDLYIVNKNNSIMYSQSRALIESPLDYDFVRNLGGLDSGYQNVNKDGKEMRMVYYTSPYSLWKVICFIPVDEFSKDAFSIKIFMTILTLICLVIVLTFSFVASSKLLRPINKLVEAMAEVEKGNFSTRINVKSHDEIKYIADSFNSMTSNIENLINKAYTAQLKQKEAELSALQRQINPHFLYNTLESIRGVSLFYGLHNIASMSKSLSMLFRYSISDTLSVTIRDEIKHLDNYIQIQNFRHDDKFEVCYNIPNDLYDYKILKFTLQPLVENSIKHGLEVKMGKGKIQIDISKVDNSLEIIIRDDGIGMSTERVCELNKKLAEDVALISGNSEATTEAGTGIGVINVNARIKLYFGSQYGLKYITCESGACVTIDLPAVKYEELT